MIGHNSPRRVLVTGASRGIGKEIAALYEANGYDVQAPGREILDLSEPHSVDDYVKENKETGFDIIINNAGCNYIHEIDQLETKDTEEMFNVNLLAPIRLLEGFIPGMKKRRFGRIVNIGSIWGVISKPGRSIYSVTKHGIHGLTKTLALEVGRYGILINTVAPGQTRTELTIKNNTPEDIAKMERDIPLGRLAEPEEIARVVYMLGNEKNTYITGQEIVVDGGLTIQ